ncbi:hypothetical protein AVEN_42650-1 [Araneus ventricosus]|uniref:Uncharacterized protein n=1 Tax=Araneus ventricosus TaxID=182803 RepID=A0A4Y2BND0_ARAVE|nr:hypothetical protein AVEN_42650-1 [Araneus ventricosus]
MFLPGNNASFDQVYKKNRNSYVGEEDEHIYYRAERSDSIREVRGRDGLAASLNIKIRGLSSRPDSINDSVLYICGTAAKWHVNLRNQ